MARSIDDSTAYERLVNSSSSQREPSRSSSGTDDEQKGGSRHDECRDPRLGDLDPIERADARPDGLVEDVIVRLNEDSGNAGGVGRVGRRQAP